MARYRDEVRPRLLVNVGEPALFLTSYGAAFNPDVLSRQVDVTFKKVDHDRSHHALLSGLIDAQSA